MEQITTKIHKNEAQNWHLLTYSFNFRSPWRIAPRDRALHTGAMPSELAGFAKQQTERKAATRKSQTENKVHIVFEYVQYQYENICINGLQ